METVTINPTWRAMVPYLRTLIECGSYEGKRIAIEELERMADLADLYVAEKSK